MSDIVQIRFIDEVIFKHALLVDEGGFLYRRDIKPGAARWQDYPADDIGNAASTSLSYVCPCGCGVAIQIHVYTATVGHGWHWDGDRNKPTLKPSIQHHSPCRWHGYLTAGEFKRQ